jgi:hypothetical protein
MENGFHSTLSNYVIIVLNIVNCYIQLQKWNNFISLQFLNNVFIILTILFRPLVYLLSKRLKLFDFPTFRL